MMMDAPRDETVARRALLKHVAHFEVGGGPSALQPCCTQPENLTREHAVPQRKEVVRLCRRCGRRHFTLHAEPGVIARPGGGGGL